MMQDSTFRQKYNHIDSNRSSESRCRNQENAWTEIRGNSSDLSSSKLIHIQRTLELHVTPAATPEAAQTLANREREDRENGP